MPGRNIYKIYSEDAYYHVYNRGANKQQVFTDDQDYGVFLGLLKRYLGEEAALQSNRQPHISYRSQVELLAYCLMPNHFHLFLYQYVSDGMPNLLKSVTTAYTMYFNKRHGRSGPLFGQRYRAVMILSDEQLLHASRYIHMNPREYETWKWSSLDHYKGRKRASWLKPDKVLELHKGYGSYEGFLADYRDRRDKLAEQKTVLADA